MQKKVEELYREYIRELLAKGLVMAGHRYVKLPDEARELYPDLRPFTHAVQAPKGPMLLCDPAAFRMFTEQVRAATEDQYEQLLRAQRRIDELEQAERRCALLIAQGRKFGRVKGTEKLIYYFTLPSGKKATATADTHEGCLDAAMSRLAEHALAVVDHSLSE